MLYETPGPTLRTNSGHVRGLSLSCFLLNLKGLKSEIEFSWHGYGRERGLAAALAAEWILQSVVSSPPETKLTQI